MKTNESFLLCEQNGETEEKDIKRKIEEKKRKRKSKIDKRDINIKGAVGLGSENKRLRDTDAMRKLHNTDSRKLI